VATTHSLNASVPANAKFTDTTYGTATDLADGLMSLEHKKKVDQINIAYGTCSTAADTSVKHVVLTEDS
jgi:glycosylphosphatidylinositol transamidase (GPIT) subunit GPI8